MQIQNADTLHKGGGGEGEVRCGGFGVRFTAPKNTPAEVYLASDTAVYLSLG